MSRFMMFCAVLFAFLFMSPVALAAPPEEDAKAVEAGEAEDAGDEDAKADELADEKAPDDAEAAGGGDGDGEAADEKAAEDGGEDGEEPTTEELVEGAKDVIEAARSHEWALMVSGIIMLVLAGLRRFKVLSKLPKNAVPWVSMVMGVLAVVGDSFSTGGEITMSRLLQGVMAGMAASGAWAMIGKHLPVIGSAKKAESES